MRTKKTTAPKEREAAIQTAIESLLIAYRNMGQLLYIKNNTGAISAGKHFIRFGMEGSPDFVVFLSDGVTIHMEVKNATGKLRNSQEEWFLRCKELGHAYVIVRGVDEADRVLRRYI